MDQGSGFCRKCGAALTPGAAFCSACGQRVGAVISQDALRITEDDAKRMARAQTMEQGRNIWIGCGVLMAIIVVGGILLATMM